jgi:hypothetical protein
MRQIIQSQYCILNDYATYLQVFKHFFPATILSHLDDIKTSTCWYVLFKVGSKCQQSDLQGISVTISTIRRIQAKNVIYFKLIYIKFVTCNVINS